MRITYATDRDFEGWGDPWPKEEGDLSQIALWLVQQQLMQNGEPVAFNVVKRRVEDFTPAPPSEPRAYLAFSLPGQEGSSEMLIAHGLWSGRKAARAVDLVAAAMPALIVLLDRLLNASRVERQRRQLTALANMTQALVATQDLESALGDLVTAVAAGSGFDYVTVYLWDADSGRCTLVVTSESRFSTGTLIAEFRGLAAEHYEAMAGEAIRTGEPIVSPDLQHDERLPTALRNFFERALLVSQGMFPLLFGDEVLGTISFDSYRPRSYPPEEVELLKGLAAQVATALKGLRMYHELAESREQIRQYAEQLQSSMEIQHRLARTDPLTGMPNRRYLQEVIDAECSRVRRESGILSVAMADLDNLKAVNDTYGHPAGDEVLIALSQLARRTCRQMDVVGRYGGDEFVFVLPSASVEAAGQFAERFRERVAEERFRPCPDAELRLTVSLGTAGTNGGALDGPPELVERADRALYKAKTGGRNRTCLYFPDGRLAWAA